VYVCSGGDFATSTLGEGVGGLAGVGCWTLWGGDMFLVVMYVFCVYLILLILHTLFAIFIGFF
jgi:hypothetical protein